MRRDSDTVPLQDRPSGCPPALGRAPQQLHCGTFPARWQLTGTPPLPPTQHGGAQRSGSPLTAARSCYDLGSALQKKPQRCKKSRSATRVPSERPPPVPAPKVPVSRAASPAPCPHGTRELLCDEIPGNARAEGRREASAGFARASPDREAEEAARPAASNAHPGPSRAPAHRAALQHGRGKRSLKPRSVPPSARWARRQRTAPLPHPSPPLRVTPTVPLAPPAAT